MQNGAADRGALHADDERVVQQVLALQEVRVRRERVAHARRHVVWEVEVPSQARAVPSEKLRVSVIY